MLFAAFPRTRAAHWRWSGVLALALLCVFCSAATASAQLGQLVSPGPLTKAHAALEGAANCQKCHAPGKKVTADLCLSCHKPVGERMRLKKGIHRDITNDCTKCHVEHAGINAELRPFNLKTFDHGRDAGYALEGRHAATAVTCAKCHKTRSYLTLTTTCTSCHKDVHTPTLGQNCLTCHPMTAAFKDAKTRFDHSKSAFVLEGGHTKVACEKCHVNKTYKGVKFALCADCHKAPHRQTLGPDCKSCHTVETWKTQKIDHSKTPYPLKGKHAELACIKCHVKPSRLQVLKFDRCASCHQDPHKGAFKQDCGSCHTETRFGRATFDHTKSTKFPLTGKHEPLACVKCHKNVSVGQAAPAKVVDFRGLSTTCVSCHADIHKGELSQACETCHTSTTFRVANYVHPKLPEFFGGRHKGVACASCHVLQPPSAPRRPDAPIATWSFKNVPTACASCHADVHLGQVGTACETCHKIDSAKFTEITFSHARSKYQLTGKHETVDCRKCHKPETAAFPAGRGTAVRLKGIDTKCASCHADTHLGQLGAACETCHTTTTFKVATYTHTKASAGVMTGKHTKLACAACHKPQDAQYPGGRGTAIRYKVGQTCVSCHADQHRGALGTACETCHSTAEWRTVSRAFHKTASFKLEGRHIDTECASCHWNGVIKGTPTKCYDCHWVRRQDDRYQTKLGNDCEGCHRPTSWTAVTWNHGAATGVVLSPVHRTLGCVGCHKNGSFTTGGITCYSCHAEDYRSTRSPNHVAAGMPTTCEMCHRSSHTSWSQASLSHQTFPLTGAHVTTACASCHANGVYQGTPNTCIGCHKTNYDRTTQPNHAAAGFPTTCTACHSTAATTWAAAFNHTGFYALVGSHATQACASCHVNNVYKGTPTSCIGCHKTKYDRTTQPNHAAAGFSTTCDACHNASAATWSATFNHNSAYPLVGLHATQACATCHVNNVYKGTPRTCIGCHKTDYDRTTKPSHAASGFGTTCDSCHSASATSWSATFNHTSAFPLVGIHATQACAACHINNVFAGTPRTCIGCHKTDYDRTTKPNHASSGFGTACESCHNASSSSWTATFNHAATFPLVGLHAAQACTACHINNVFAGTPRTCFGCHKTNYDRTTTPNHAGAGFGTTCDSCHSASASSWSATFNHAASFPLVGVHAAQACTACHINNVYNGTPRTCVGCHKTKYDRTTNPNHAAAGFSTTCDTCHSATAAAWTATLNHNQYFVLAGRHLTASCASCHINNVYKGTSRTCYPCHQTNYTSTKTPNHLSAGFPTTCDSCHKFTDTAWTQGTFSHTWFPITSGRHAGHTCVECHNDSSNYKVFTCVTCHTKSKMDSEHKGRAGYRYDSAACFSCHPRG
jgi:hypothetical protein